MLHTDFADSIRKNLLAAMGADACRCACAERGGQAPFEGNTESLGEIRGYRYERGSTQFSLGIPGMIAEREEWFMDMTPGFPVEIRENDRLIFTNGDQRRVVLVHRSGGHAGEDIYRLYRLEAI